MRKISDAIENNIVTMTENGYSSRKIAQQLNISQGTVIAARKRQKIVPAPNQGGRPRLLKDSDARFMIRELKKKDSRTPKQAAAALNKHVSAWTARRALRRIGFVAAIKKKNLLCLTKTLRSGCNFVRPM